MAWASSVGLQITAVEDGSVSMARDREGSAMPPPDITDVAAQFEIGFVLNKS